MNQILVRYISFPTIAKGVSCFKEFANYKKCVKPHKPYKFGVCHTIGDEIDLLADKVGFVSREVFSKSKGRHSWVEAYGVELSKYVKEVIENGGIDWTVNGEEVKFYCPKGEFVLWPLKE